MPVFIGTCTTCGEQVRIKHDGTAYRHKGTDEFSLATDGICDGSHAYVLEESAYWEELFNEA